MAREVAVHPQAPQATRQSAFGSYDKFREEFKTAATAADSGRDGRG